MTPTKQAVEAARERLAREADDAGLDGIAMMYREGHSDSAHETQALAIALQEMSDAVKGALDVGTDKTWEPIDRHQVTIFLSRFILPKATTPLADCLLELDLSSDAPEAEHDAEWLEKALAKRGLQIMPVQS